MERDALDGLRRESLTELLVGLTELLVILKSTTDLHRCDGVARI